MVNVKTEDQLFDEYAKPFALLDTNCPSDVEVEHVHSDRCKVEQFFKISEMRSKLYRSMMEQCNEHLQKRIFEKCKQLAENNNNKSYTIDYENI